MDDNAARLFLPTAAAAELVSGVVKLRRLGRVRDAEAVGEWLEQVLHDYAERIVPFDLMAARETGVLQDRARTAGLSPGFADLAIAGTAMARGMLLLTRNLRHVAPLGVAAHDPFATPPP